MQHIPVVKPRLVKRDFFFQFLKVVDVVPTAQTTGSYHRQDLCLFTVGEEPHRTGEWRQEASGREAEASQ